MLANVIGRTFSWNSPQGNCGSLVYIFEWAPAMHMDVDSMFPGFILSVNRTQTAHKLAVLFKILFCLMLQEFMCKMCFDCKYS